MRKPMTRRPIPRRAYLTQPGLDDLRKRGDKAASRLNNRLQRRSLLSRVLEWFRG